MAAKPGLRAVGADEAPPKVSERSHRELLVKMRDRIESAVFDPKCPPRDLASLTRRLQDIAKEIESIDLRASQEVKSSAGGPVDDSFDASAI